MAWGQYDKLNRPQWQWPAPCCQRGKAANCHCCVNSTGLRPKRDAVVAVDAMKGGTILFSAALPGWVALAGRARAARRARVHGWSMWSSLYCDAGCCRDP
jgi:hypothetical protein